MEEYVDTNMTSFDDTLYIYDAFDLLKLQMDVEQAEQDEEDRTRRRRDMEERDARQPSPEPTPVPTEEPTTQPVGSPASSSSPHPQPAAPTSQQPTTKPQQQKQTKTPAAAPEKAPAPAEVKKESPSQRPVEAKVLDERTRKLLADVDCSYNSMVSQRDKTREKKTDDLENVKVPDWFPKTPSKFDFKSNKIDDEFLMFLFYYEQGTPAQLKAAELLKGRGWIFHKGYQKWYKKCAETGYRSDSSETGEYSCFEYESWSFISKMHFTFFSNFLEN